MAALKYQLTNETDISAILNNIKHFADQVGFNETRSMMVATAASELIRNVIIHADEGVIHIDSLSNNQHEGISIQVADTGPGIEDINLAMQDNFSTKGGLGIGLPGVKRLMDEIVIDSKVNRGTTITAIKWVK